MKLDSGKSIDELRREDMEVSHRRDVVCKRMTEIDAELSGGVQGLRRGVLKKEKGKYVREVVELNARRRNIMNMMALIVSDRKAFEPANMTVSDHTLVRWLQRKHGIDVKKLKDEIEATVKSESSKSSLSDRDGVRVEASDGMIYVIDPKTEVVVTCYPVGGEAD